MMFFLLQGIVPSSVEASVKGSWFQITIKGNLDLYRYEKLPNYTQTKHDKHMQKYLADPNIKKCEDR